MNLWDVLASGPPNVLREGYYNPRDYSEWRVGDTITMTLNGPKIGNPPKGATVTMTEAQREARFTVPESPRWLTSDTEAKVNRGRPAYAVCRCGHWETDHDQAGCRKCPNCRPYRFYEFRYELLAPEKCGQCGAVKPHATGEPKA